jgi:hypothetical protein
MRLSRSHLAAAAFTALVASCAAPPPPPPAPVPQTSAAVPAPRSCVELQRISEARVVDDRTIDFHMRDGTVLRNSLPNSCPSLGFEKAFTYSTSLSRLCSTDIITVIHTGGGPRTGASCGLGQFVPAPPAASTPK